jgi:hypothetical protein
MIKCKPGVTRFQYAIKKGVSEGFVRKLIKDETLAAAVLANNRIDRILADKLWAKWVPSAHDRASATLRQARHRKLKAIVSTIQDQIDAMEAELMPAAAFYEGNRAFATYVRNLFMGIAEIAPEVTGKSPGEVFDILHKAVDEALGALQQTNVVGEKGALAMRGAEPARDLSAMSSKDLLTLKTNLLARRLELTRSKGRGELVDIVKSLRPLQDEILLARTNLLRLPTKVAESMAGHDEAGARRMQETALDQITQFRALRGSRLVIRKYT